MTRTVKYIAMLSMGCLLLSCTTWDRINGTTAEEKQRFKMSRDQLWNANRQYEMQNQRLKDQEKQLKADLQENEHKIKALTQEIAFLKKGNSRLINEKTALEDKIAENEEKQATPGPEASDSITKKPIERLKIKVLGGDGTLRSANKMAARLREMGYRIERTQVAPTSNFSKNTIFYKKAAKNEAEALAARIGGPTISKALTWESVFDLILVTGKN